MYRYGTVRGEAIMYWILVIMFVAAGNNGVAITIIDGFSKEGCLRAKAELTKTWPLGNRTTNDPTNKTLAAECVERK